MKVLKLLLLISALLIPIGITLPARADVAGNIERTGLYCGLDPGLVLLEDNEKSFQRYIRFNLRVGWGFTRWFQFGGDVTGDILAATGGGTHIAGDAYFQPAVTFFPIAGFNIRGAGGLDISDSARWIATASTGYEFGISDSAGIGFSLVFNQLFHTDERSNWRMYGILLYFTGYRLHESYEEEYRF